MFPFVRTCEVPADLCAFLRAVVQPVLTEQGMLAVVPVKVAPGGHA